MEKSNISTVGVSGPSNSGSASRPWRLPREAASEERRYASKVLRQGSKEGAILNARAIVFCYEADALLDEKESELGITEELTSARGMVREFREVATNRRAHDKELVEAARGGAARALKAVGLEGPMRTALSHRPPEKWPVMHEVIHGLWCGGWAALNDNCRALVERNITCVVSVVSADKRALPKSIISEHLHIHAHDDSKANLLQQFPRIVEFVDQNLKRNNCVYIHCGAGVSRAPTSTTAYLMWRYRLPATEALTMVKRARPMTRPNVNFVSQLKEWEKHIEGLHVPVVQSTRSIDRCGEANVSSESPIGIRDQDNVEAGYIDNES